MSSHVGWAALSDKLGTVHPTDDGWREEGGTRVAARALIDVIGDAAFSDAVDFHVTGTRGHEVARSVLMMLAPPAAADRCLEVFRTTDDEQEAADAIELLRVVADRRVLDWMPELLASDNVGVRIWSMGVIDQLLIMEEISRDEAMPFIEQGLQDAHAGVRPAAAQVVELIEYDEEVMRIREHNAA